MFRVFHIRLSKRLPVRFAAFKAASLNKVSPRDVLLLGVAAAVTGLGILAGGHAGLVTGSSRTRIDVNPADPARNIPLRVEPLVRPIFSKDSPEAVAIARMVQEPPAGPVNVSYCCHLLRLYGLGPIPHRRFGSGREVVAAITNQKLSETFFGQSIFFQTRNGLRYRDLNLQKIPAGENHRDFCLATFAELGLSLSTPITTLDQSFTIRDLLQDSVENFDIKQEELPWTAVAYALYLAPRRDWTNRFRECFSFDELVITLMQVPLDRASCGGTHLLYALTILSRVDRSTAYLSEPVRQQLSEYLGLWAVRAAESQHKEGFWDWDWHEADKRTETSSPPFRDTLVARLVVTGHLIEWLEMLPLEIQPRAIVYRGATRWICEVLANRLKDTDFDGFCPRVHALCAVKTLIHRNG